MEGMVLHVENRLQGHGEMKNGLTHWTNSQFVHVEAGCRILRTENSENRPLTLLTVK